MSAGDLATAPDADGSESAARLRAILLVVIGVSLFGVMDGIGKLLGAAHYPVGQIVWARFAFAVPLVLLVAARTSGWRLFHTRHPILQVARGLLPLVASVTVILGLGRMPLADFTAISFASPLFVVVLAVPLLREQMSRATWVGIVLGFAGVLLIARPGLGALSWTALFPLATAALFGFYQVLTRFVSRNDSPVVSFACMIAAGAIAASPALLFGWRMPGAFDAALFVLTGFLFGGAHLLLIKAFALAPANVLAPFTYAQIVAATLFGFLVFGDMPDIWSAAGTVLIVAAGLYVLRRRT